MADIFQLIQVAAVPSVVYDLVSSGVGWTKWWAEDVTEAGDGTVDVGFFSRSMVCRFRPGSRTPVSRVTWYCLAGGEWEGTALEFTVEVSSPNTTLRFKHTGWKAETDYFAMCGATWGTLLFRLKAAAEGGNPPPLFSAAAMAAF